MSGTNPHTQLRALLDDTGLTQSEFAAVLRCDVATLERWLAGALIPKSTQAWLARVHELRVTRERVYLVLRR